ncbi:MAG TPA: SurA N-terminal domain-containing protein [Bauldia sp.]|nr:SurA N-terminal domain-containing protein [Bauldia sp.]
MLNSLRGYATGWVAQLLMGLLVLSFAAWGVNDVFNGFRSSDVAMVGSVAITAADFQRDFDAATRQLSQQVGRALTPDEARQVGVQNDVMSKLVRDATLDNTAARMNLGISNQELTKIIASNPQFAGTNGTFDRRVLQQLVQQVGYSEDDFVMAQRRALVRLQLQQAFAGAITSPATYLRAVHDYQSEERDISYILLSAPLASDIPDPTETELNTYFTAHKDQWKAPELRAVSYFALTAADVTDVASVTDDDAKKAYDTQTARFSTPENRKIEQIVFKDRAEADAAAAALTGGKTFDALMTERNLKPTDVDLGLVTKDKVLDPKIAEAAFAATLNVPTPVVDGQFGPAILRVTEINPAKTTSFDDAKDTVKKEIAAQRANAEVSATHDAIEDARAGGDPLATIAAKYSLKVVTVPAVDETGNDAAGNPVKLPTGLDTAVFQAGVGDENDPIQSDGGSFVWYEVTGTTPPHDRTLAEVHDKVVAAWKDAQREQKLDDTAVAAKQRLDNKEDIQKIATDLGAIVKTAPKLTRASKATPELSEAAIAAAFGGPQGSAAMAEGVQPLTRLVLRVDNITVPPFDPAAADLANSKQTLDGQFVNAFLSLYTGQLQTQTKVTFNQAALQTVLGAPTANE